jgi:hypothetical protein
MQYSANRVSSHVFMTERERPKALHALFGLGLAPNCRFRSIRTCFDTPAATPWPMPARTPGRCKPISVTRPSSTRSEARERTRVRQGGGKRGEPKPIAAVMGRSDFGPK